MCITAGLAWFSDAISSIVVSWRSCSRRRIAAASGSEDWISSNTASEAGLLAMPDCMPVRAEPRGRALPLPLPHRPLLDPLLARRHHHAVHEAPRRVDVVRIEAAEFHD